MSRWLVKPDLASLILRLMLAILFIAQGVLKITQYDGGTSWYTAPGTVLPPLLQAVVAWGELVCGVALAVGLLTRWAALGLIVMQLGAIYLVSWSEGLTHVAPAFLRDVVVHEPGYAYNYAIIGMCASLVVLGGGIVSLDHFLCGRRRAAAVAPYRVPEVREVVHA
jgi:putative oxidoreductase